MAYNGTIEDFKKRKMISKALVRTHFVKPWQFRVEIDDKSALMTKKDGSHHSVFDYLAKSVGFGPTEFETEPVSAGAGIFTYPKSSQPVVVTMTVRDNVDRLLYSWFNAWAAKVLNSDGTFNLPANYLKMLTIYNVKDDRTESELWKGLMYPQKMGDIEHSVDGEGFTEFPVVFQQFATVGKYT